jgi:cold shock CspA family protein
MSEDLTNEKPRQRGKISKWIEPRGFGFILPIDGANEVFFHVSALRNPNIEPAVGDAVSYELSQRHDGRPKAVHVESAEA